MATLNLGNFPIIPSAVKIATTQNYVGGLGIHEPAIYSKLVSRYGNQSIQSLVAMLGNFIPVSAQEFTHYEDDFIHSSFTAQTATVPTSGTTATTFTIAAGFLGANSATAPLASGAGVGKAFVRVGDVVKVEAKSGAAPQLALVTATAADNTFAIVPYGAAWAFNAGDNATELRFIVVGRESVGRSQTPNDTLSPRVYKYTNGVMKIEDAYIIEGGEKTNKLWFEVEAGGKRGWSWGVKGQGDTQMRFENYAELMMIVGELNATAATTHRGTEGLEKAVKTRGQELDLGGTAFAMADADTMIKSLDKYKGSKYNALYAGIDLRAAIDDAVGGVNAYVSGARNFGTFSDAMEKKGIKLEFDYFERLGYKFMLNTYDLFNHPHLLGASGFDYSGSGLVVPLGGGKEPKTGDNMPYISVRYKALDGYSRLMETWPTGGADGVYTNDLDEIKINYRTERGFEIFCPNKFVWISK